jgi:hypothetical protein
MDNRPVKIYCTRDVSRLRYIAGLILGEILGLKWDIVTDKRRLGKFPVINYSDEDIQGAFKLAPAELLMETGVRNQEVQVSRWKDLPVFFNREGGSDLPFDIFAASFYLVTRYEEYLDSDPDQFSQFRASSSIALRNGFLGMPVVDLWAKEFAKVLLKKYSTLTFKRNEYKALLILDADKFPEKSFFNSVGNLLTDFKARKILKRDHIIDNDRQEKDHHDEFDYIIEIIKKSKWDVKFFFPVGDHSSSEKHPSWKNSEYRHLIKKVAESCETGLKPSIKASSDYSLICSELKRLKEIVAKDIFSSRFQPKKSALTNSYCEAYRTSIRNDYSMGYPEEPGFRASIARSFNFYDLLQDKVTDLRIFPFQLMDESFSLSGGEAYTEVLTKLMTETRKAGGHFVCVWHNSSLYDCEGMKQRIEMF